MKIKLKRKKTKTFFVVGNKKKGKTMRSWCHDIQLNDTRHNGTQHDFLGATRQAEYCYDEYCIFILC
jgi:hypothetical protein